MSKFLCNGLPSIQTQWDKWLLFFCDERLVSFSDSDSTYKVYAEGLIGKSPLREEQFVQINPDLEGKEQGMRQIVGECGQIYLSTQIL